MEQGWEHSLKETLNSGITCIAFQKLTFLGGLIRKPWAFIAADMGSSFMPWFAAPGSNVLGTDPAPHILQLWPQAGGNRFSLWFASANVLAAD